MLQFVQCSGVPSGKQWKIKMNRYPVYPEEDGYDRPINPYGEHYERWPQPTTNKRHENCQEQEAS
jgi:hypothetical protein